MCTNHYCSICGTNTFLLGDKGDKGIKGLSCSVGDLIKGERGPKGDQGFPGSYLAEQ